MRIKFRAPTLTAVGPQSLINFESLRTLTPLEVQVVNLMTREPVNWNGRFLRDYCPSSIYAGIAQCLSEVCALINAVLFYH